MYVNFALVDNNSTENVWVENKLIHEDQLNEKHYPICSISSNAKCYLKESYNLRDVQNFLDLYNETKHEESTFPVSRARLHAFFLLRTKSIRTSRL